MQLLKIATRITLLIAVAMGACGLVVGNASLREDREVARARYARAATDLGRVTGELNATENRLRKLTTSLHAVEWEAREELQMVKPGERLVLLQFENPAPATPAGEPQKTPSSHP